MPRKLRALTADSKQAGFVERGGSGRHRNFKHPSGVKLTLGGKLGDEAKPYQEEAVREAIEEASA